MTTCGILGHAWRRYSHEMNLNMLRCIQCAAVKPRPMPSPPFVAMRHCSVFGHDWRPLADAPGDAFCAKCTVIKSSRQDIVCGTSVQSTQSLAATAVETQPERAERSRHMNGITEGNLITNGTTRAVVLAATDSFLIAVPEAGGAEFALSASNISGWRNVYDAPAPLNIKRKTVVYDADGNRVDGYKFESRARRNNDARFAGSGYWIGTVDPSTFTWVPA